MKIKIKRLLSIYDSVLEACKRYASLKFLIIVSTVFFIIMIGIVGFRAGKQNKVNEDQNLAVIKVKTIKLKPEKYVPFLNLHGSIEPFQKVDIVSKTSGVVQKVLVKEGESIKEGQPLVIMETLQLELELKKAEAGLESAVSAKKLAYEKYQKARNTAKSRLLEIEKKKVLMKEAMLELEKGRKTFNGKEILFEEGGISEEELEMSKLAFVSLEAKYALSKKELDSVSVGFTEADIHKQGKRIAKDKSDLLEAIIELNSAMEKAELDVSESNVSIAKVQADSVRELIAASTIRSPIQGQVAFINKHPGEFVNQGGVQNSEQAIMVLVDVSKLYVRANIQEKDIATIHTDSRLKITADSFPGEIFSAKTENISPIVDPLTHSADVKAVLINSDSKLKPGMFIRVTLFNGEEKEGVFVPSELISSNADSTRELFVVTGNRIFKSQVKTGIELNGRTEIVSGLKLNDLVLSEKVEGLGEGTVVRTETQ